MATNGRLEHIHTPTASPCARHHDLVSNTSTSHCTSVCVHILTRLPPHHQRSLTAVAPTATRTSYHHPPPTSTAPDTQSIHPPISYHPANSLTRGTALTPKRTGAHPNLPVATTNYPARQIHRGSEPGTIPRVHATQHSRAVHTNTPHKPYTLRTGTTPMQTPLYPLVPPPRQKCIATRTRGDGGLPFGQGPCKIVKNTSTSDGRLVP